MPTEPASPVRAWEVARTDPDACPGPTEAAGLRWTAVGTALGGGLTAAATGLADAPRHDFDGEDWWFRTRLHAGAPVPGEELALALEGLATIADVYFDGEPLLHSESMWAAHELALGDRLADGEGELMICCRALAPRLAVRRRPRARWRTRLVASQNLRFVRTMLLGRAPGFAPGPAVVGPWRPVSLVRRRGLIAEAVTLAGRVEGDAGVLACSGRLRATDATARPAAVTVTVTGLEGECCCELALDGTGAFAGEMRLERVRRWWPHTHGEPVLYDVSLAAGEVELHHGRTGFRELQHAPDLAADGPNLRINGVPIFARGAVWTPLSLADPHADPAALRAVLQQAVGAGLNMLRLPGIGTWESRAFHDLCDELGILVWQDFMFANLDYPQTDMEFMAAVAAEGHEQLGALAGRPSLAVVCGGSEVAQQVAMMGLDPALAEGPLYGELLPRLVQEARIDAPYVPSAPWGGELPFRTDRGVANYYGVGAYLRPLEDARRAQLRFAAECLAFANVPDDDALAHLREAGAAVHHPAWKAGVPRDTGAGWDFDDVRDHYLRLVLGVDPLALRYAEPDRYLELSRAAAGEVMARTFGEWRRTGSPCAGALVLWLKDLAPGAGWGLLDHRGLPKTVLHHLRRALAPVAVWITDEGLNGLHAHVANDRPGPLRARLRLALYRGRETLVEETELALALPGHGAVTHDLEALLGHFADLSWAYRFGAAAQDLVAVALEPEPTEREAEPLSEAFWHPAGRSLAPESADRLGLSGELTSLGADRALLTVRTRRFADGVRIAVPGWAPADDAFGLEPGHARSIVLARRDAAPGAPPAATVSALNLAAPVRVASPADGVRD